MDSKPLVTVAEVKSLLSIRDTNTEHDETIAHLIGAATAQIEASIGRFLTKQAHEERFPSANTVSERLDLYGVSETGMTTSVRTHTLRLSGVNVEPGSVTIHYDRSREFSEDTLVSPKDYILDPVSGTIRLMISMREAPDAIKVNYVAGWEAAGEDGKETLSDALPAGIREAAILQTGYLYQRRRLTNLGLTGDRAQGKADGYVQTLPWASKQGLMPEAIGHLRQYRRPVMGRY